MRIYLHKECNHLCVWDVNKEFEVLVDEPKTARESKCCNCGTWFKDCMIHVT